MARRRARLLKAMRLALAGFAALSLASFAWMATLAPMPGEGAQGARWKLTGWRQAVPRETPAPPPAWTGKLPTRASEWHDALAERGYTLTRMRALEGDVPRLFLAKLPPDVEAIDSIEMRKAVFIKLLLPLILAENERVLADRLRLMQAAEWLRASFRIPARERAFLDDLARRYGVEPDDLDELTRRVDGVPVSLALAQAALETGWGTSKLATRGQALFGQIALRGGGEQRLIVTRTFEQLADAVAAYVANLNTHRAYAGLRAAREASRRAGFVPGGDDLAGHLQAYSERGGDYIQELRAIMRVNRLAPFDHARLDRS